VITVEDLADFNESINLMVYGDSGVGKTPLAGKAPNSVFLSTEKGTISAKRFGSKSKLIRCHTWERLEAAIDYLEANPSEFDWAIVDSATKMQQLLLRYLLKNNVEDGKKMADLDVPQIQDHQKWQNMYKRFIDRLIDLDVNVIFVATAMHKEDAEGDDLVLPDIQGKDYAIAQYACAQMDGVYYLATQTNKKTEQPEWFLLTKSRPPYFAKDRFNALPPVLRRPDMADIIEAILESGEADQPNKNVEKRRAGKQAKSQPVEELDDDFEDDEDLEEDAEDLEDDSDLEDDADDFDDEDEDDEEEPPRKPAQRRAPARRASAPTRKSSVRSKASSKAKDDEDDFDPDDDEDDDFDDED